MKLLRLLVLVIVPLLFIGLADAADRGVKTVRLASGQDAATVPDGRAWKIEGLSPYKSENGVGTADLYIDGQVFIGSNKAYTVSGKFDVVIANKQSSPLWILGGSKVRVGDSRGSLVAKEVAEP